METLTEAVNSDAALPGGLFWLHRGDSKPMAAVADLLALARDKGIDGGLVRIVSFDETMRDLIRLCQGLDTKALDAFSAERRRWTPPPALGGRKGWPVVRLNGLELVQIPSHCRRIVCGIGGTSEVREALARAAVNAIGTRTRAGVLAFGRDGELRRAFDAHDVTEFDLHAIETRRLRYDSSERGLLREAVSVALSCNFEMTVNRRRGGDLLAPAVPDHDTWRDLRELVGATAGVVPGDPTLRWREGVALRLDWADDRLWLLIEPRVVFDGLSELNRVRATDFARERTVRRYNAQLNALMGYWSARFSNHGEELQTFNIGDGIDAVFRFGVETAYSRRISA
jgi:hypothetical protein